MIEKTFHNVISGVTRPFTSRSKATEGPSETTPADPQETFTPTQTQAPVESERKSPLEAAKRAAITGTGLTLMGVPAPISAGVAAVQFAHEAAPETSAKVLKNTAAVATITAAGVVVTANALAGPIAEIGGQFIRHGLGHDVAGLTD
ncbi:MAG: hypothetical protein KC910_05525 [Candidatus Eremiobacteraeota bacterium]|nr:hypothetical protein [Candidatus Eremiobacteraeota bacterium]